jgi:choline transport protein
MASMTHPEAKSVPHSSSDKGDTGVHEAHLTEINETGHIQELERNFSLLSICSVGIVTGNTWCGT